MQPSNSPSQEESPEAFAARLGLSFRNIRHLHRALTHRSYINEHPTALEDNERLEFLGDAILDFLVTTWLFHQFPEMSEGELTRLRAALVGTSQFAAFSRQLQIGRAMRLGRGEAEGGGRERDTLLCAAFEALVAALYLDSGLDAVREFVAPLLEPAAERIVAERQGQDAKSLLQEWSQSQGLGVPHYRQVSVSGPHHNRLYEFEVSIDGKVYGRGTGPNKQAASKQAAHNALIALGLESA